MLLERRVERVGVDFLTNRPLHRTYLIHDLPKPTSPKQEGTAFQYKAGVDFFTNGPQYRTGHLREK